MKPIINSFDALAPLIVQKYERQLPTAFDESTSLLSKMNKIIEQLNRIGQLTNDTVDQWNQAMEWVMNDGLSEAIVDLMNQWLNDGTLAQIINTDVFNMKADTTYVNTELGKKANTFDVNTQFSTVNTQISTLDDSLKPVAKTGSYSDLTNQPLITNPDRVLRVGTWNIKRQADRNGIDQDVTTNHRNILIMEGLDLVGLQELEVGGTGTHPNSVDPINAIAHPNLGFRKFAKTIDLNDGSGGEYGIGMLSRYGTIRYTSTMLTKTTGEQRVLQSADMYVGNKKIIVMNTHLNWIPHQDRYDQMTYIKNHLLSLGNASFILLGDFNVLSKTEYTTYFSQWKWANGNNGVWFDTFYDPAYTDEKAIDNIICSNDFTISNVGVHDASLLSDHHLLKCELRW